MYILLQIEHRLKYIFIWLIYLYRRRNFILNRNAFTGCFNFETIIYVFLRYYLLLLIFTIIYWFVYILLCIACIASCLNFYALSIMAIIEQGVKCVKYPCLILGIFLSSLGCCLETTDHRCTCALVASNVEKIYGVILPALNLGQVWLLYFALLTSKPWRCCLFLRALNFFDDFCWDIVRL